MARYRPGARRLHAKAVERGAQVSTAHWRRGGRSWAKKARSKKQPAREATAPCKL